MADKLDFVMRDLQTHLQNAKLETQTISSIARKGDEKLVEQFLSEAIFTKSSDKSRVELADNTSAVLQSQLYVACFWGFKDVVRGILALCEEQGLEVDVNVQNKNTLWTPLHAATFQEHGPIIMTLLEYGAQPELPDAEGRTSKDFASASDKVWPHFQALGLRRTPKSELAEMGILKKNDPGGGDMFGQGGSGISSGIAGRGIQMAQYSGEDRSDRQYSLAARGGDILAEEEFNAPKSDQPMFKIYK